MSRSATQASFVFAVLTLMQKLDVKEPTIPAVIFACYTSDTERMIGQAVVTVLNSLQNRGLPTW